MKSTIAGPPKGTMENMPNYHRTQTPVASTAAAKSVSTSSISPTKSIPAWAGPLEKALAEDTRNASAAGVQARPGATRKTSVPPHLRNKVNMAAIDTAPKLDSTAQAYEFRFNPLIKQDDRINDEALAWQLATTEVGGENAKQVSDVHHDDIQQGY
jgi:hypothetical protein